MKPSPILNRARSRAHLDLSPENRPPAALPVVAATVLSVGLSLFAGALLVVIGTAVFPCTKGYVRLVRLARVRRLEGHRPAPREERVH